MDERLEKRFRTLLEQLSDGAGESIPMACQDWANTKGASRFFGNERVNERDILAGHFQSTRQRFLDSGSNELALVLHDTTEFCFHRDHIGEIGKLTKHAGWKMRSSRIVCGILMHSSLVVTPDGLLLGLPAIKFWTRDEFKGTNALKKHVNPTRVPIEEKESIRWLQNLSEATKFLSAPDRCIHIGDRESDIYELLSRRALFDGGWSAVFEVVPGTGSEVLLRGDGNWDPEPTCLGGARQVVVLRW